MDLRGWKEGRQRMALLISVTCTTPVSEHVQPAPSVEPSVRPVCSRHYVIVLSGCLRKAEILESETFCTLVKGNLGV